MTESTGEADGSHQSRASEPWCEMDDSLPNGIELRPATHDDYDAVAAFTRDTWDEREDYIPDVYHDWLDGEHCRTLVADAGEDIAGIAQAVLLSETEAWTQGMRVNPSFRGQEIGMAITHALFRWARDQGALVARNMVFSWNQAGLGQSRAVGFEPVTEFRWLHPEPMPPQGVSDDTVQSAVDDAWQFWRESDARTELAGLALDLDESWAVRELTPELLERAAAETTLLTVGRGDQTKAMAYRTRTFDREVEDEGQTGTEREGQTGTEREGQTSIEGGEEGGPEYREETWAEYGVAAWADVDAAATLLGGIRADAASCGADNTRVLIPETPRTVSDGAMLRADPGGYPDFVFAADLTCEN